MRKRKKRIIWLIILLLIIVNTVYRYGFKYPIYKITENGEAVSDIETVEIDGVIYKSMEGTKWYPHGFDELIGFAGFPNWGIYQINDSEDDIILLQFRTIMDMRPQPILFRKSTIDIVEPTLDNITHIEFSKWDSDDDYVLDKSENKELAHKIFELIENGVNVASYMLDHDNYKNLGNIYFYNSEYPGLYYYINFCKYSNKYYFQIYNHGKTLAIPKELGQEIESYFN